MKEFIKYLKDYQVPENTSMKARMQNHQLSRQVDFSTTRAALFLDRDDTIVKDTGYMSGDDPINFIPGVIGFLAKINAIGVPIFIVTNQSGIGRGYFDEAMLFKFNDNLINLLKQEQINIEGWAFCPHKPNEGCDCRKPKPGMLISLRDKYKLDLKRSIFVGDKPSDKEIGDKYCRNGYILDELKWSNKLANRIISEFCS